MKIKHTHPAYESREARSERLKEIRRSCMELVFAQRELARKRNAGKA